ncbi:MAG: S-methyl-5-thioribose-1-phosphate isomerase, partial [Desulfobacterales bacterium]
MKVNGKNLRTIWLASDEKTVKIIDQRRLPYELRIVDLYTVDDVVMAIKDMYVRGAPLIGVTGAYGVYLAALNAPDELEQNTYLRAAAKRLKSARPTAVNLAWAVDTVLAAILKVKRADERLRTAKDQAARITEQEVENCKNIGNHGLPLIEAISRQK